MPLNQIPGHSDTPLNQIQDQSEILLILIQERSAKPHRESLRLTGKLPPLPQNCLLRTMSPPKVCLLRTLPLLQDSLSRKTSLPQDHHSVSKFLRVIRTACNRPSKSYHLRKNSRKQRPRRVLQTGHSRRSVPVLFRRPWRHKDHHPHLTARKCPQVLRRTRYSDHHKDPLKKYHPYCSKDTRHKGTRHKYDYCCKKRSWVRS